MLSFSTACQVLKEWKRVLRPTGKLVLVTPNRLFPHHEWFEDPSHCHMFSSNEITQQVESAGFVVRSVHVVNPFFIHLRLAFFAARYLQFLRHLPYFSNHGMSIVLSATRG
jgi:SAM-dependent methyltransferase